MMFSSPVRLTPLALQRILPFYPLPGGRRASPRTQTETMPMIQHISAVTFAVRSMPEAITFYTTLGFILVYGGPQARFSTLQASNAFVNLTLSPDYLPAWWGRTIFRVDDVEVLYQRVLAAGGTPAPPQNGAWGERYFHLTDPNGHELSFAQLLQ